MKPLYGDANDIRERAQRGEELARYAAQHAESTTKPIAESGWTNRFTSAIGYYFLRERGEDPADASIIEYQGGERAYISGADDNFYKEWASGRFEFLGPFTASDFEQLIQLRKLGVEARDVLALLVPYGKIHTVEGVRYPDGSHSEAIDRGERVLDELRATIGKEWEGEALAHTGEQS